MDRRDPERVAFLPAPVDSASVAVIAGAIRLGWIAQLATMRKAQSKARCAPANDHLEISSWRLVVCSPSLPYAVSDGKGFLGGELRGR